MAANKKTKMIEKPDQTPEGRKKALDAALKKIEKDFGKGAIMLWGEVPLQDIDVFSTGSLKLDKALGVGGFPKGRIIEIYGPESSGKTTIALHAVAEVQKNGGTVAYIDAENAIDKQYAQNLGVDTSKLLLSQPDTGEQGLEIANELAASGAIDLIVVDSVAALVPQSEIDGSVGDSHVGLQARMMSQALRKISGALNRTGTTTIFINQLRDKVGVTFGSAETTPGGRALKFYATIRLDVRRVSTNKDKDKNAISNNVKVKVVKNKVAPPFQEFEVELIYGEGISPISELIDLGVDTGIIDKSGAWYAYDGEKIGQGKVKAMEYLKEPDNKNILDTIREKVRTELGIIGDNQPNSDDNNSEKETVEKTTTSAKPSKTKTTKKAATTTTEKEPTENKVPTSQKASDDTDEDLSALIDDDEIAVMESKLLDESLKEDE